MYSTIDTRTVLSLARQQQADVKRSFPRRQGKVVHALPTAAVISAPSRIDVGAMSVPAPREPERESSVA